MSSKEIRIIALIYKMKTASVYPLFPQQLLIPEIREKVIHSNGQVNAFSVLANCDLPCFKQWKPPQRCQAPCWHGTMPTSGKLERRTQSVKSAWDTKKQQHQPKVREVSTLTFQTWLTALSVHSATSKEWLCWPMRGPKQVRTGMVSAVHTPINGKTPTTQWFKPTETGTWPRQRISCSPKLTFLMCQQSWDS